MHVQTCIISKTNLDALEVDLEAGDTEAGDPDATKLPSPPLRLYNYNILFGIWTTYCAMTLRTFAGRTFACQAKNLESGKDSKLESI